jgi:hypothetical protein
VPKRFANLHAVLAMLPIALLAVACMGDHADFHISSRADMADAAPLEVNDATPEPVVCTGSECSCPTGYACDYVCPDGDCTFTCAAGASCDFDCPGSNCTIDCAEGSQCRSVCASGCALTCDEGASCSQDCEGGPHAGCTCTGC